MNQKGFVNLIVIGIVLAVVLAGTVGYLTLIKKSPQPTPTPVIITTDKTECDPEEEITVTIKNNLDSSITAVTMQAFCSILRLERQEETDWKEIMNCASRVPTRPVTLESNSETIVKLNSPSSLPFAPISSGIYRIALVYAIGDKYFDKEHLISYSNEFKIKIQRK